MRKVLMIAALILTAGTAFAAGEIREAKPIACAHFDEFKGATGSTMGVCAPSKEGGKPRVLRSYVVTKLVNPSTGKPESVMVGFQ